MSGIGTLAARLTQRELLKACGLVVAGGAAAAVTAPRAALAQTLSDPDVTINGSLYVGTPGVANGQIIVTVPDNWSSIYTRTSSGVSRFALNHIASGGWTLYDFGGRDTSNNNKWEAGLSQVAGKVGIGTDQPTEKLDVIGNVKLSGHLTLGAGSVLTLGTGGSVKIGSRTIATENGCVYA